MALPLKGKYNIYTMERKLPLLLVLAFVWTFSCSAQDDLMKMAQGETKDADPITIATFKSTRLINQPTLECLGERTLDVRISHRFWDVSSGSYNAFGLDGPASIRIGLDYSYEGRLMAGIGRSSYEKLYDGFLKYRLLRQTESGSMPLSVTLFTSAAYTTQEDPNKAATGYDKYYYSTDRFSFAHSIMVGRKFSSAFSMQVSGYLVHTNLTNYIGDKNDMVAVTGLFRYKLTRSFSITAEYAARVTEYNADPSKKYYDSAGVGFEIETGGHVFQLNVSNSFGMVETQYIPYTDKSWSDGGVRIGFNISRVFHL